LKDWFFEKVATPEVRVLVRSRVVVNVKQPVILALAVVATAVQTRVRSVEVPVVARTNAIKPSDLRSQPLYRKKIIQMSFVEIQARGRSPLNPPVRVIQGGDTRGTRPCT